MKLTAAEDGRALGETWRDRMLSGDFGAAWQISERILQSYREEHCSHLPRHFQSVWNGESLAKKRILIRCYHGLGDTIQFVRYAPLVMQTGRSVAIWAQPELLPLLRTMPHGFDELLPLHNGPPPAGFDVHAEVMELPFIFRTTIETIPCSIPYFRIAPIQLLRNKLNIGLVWEAGDWEPARSIPLLLVRELAASVDANWHIIQRGAALEKCSPLLGLNSGSDDVLTAARVIAALDLLITIDSMPAHLAGALGMPTWLLLHHDADWRWMKDRTDSPWYPSMRLFRQDAPGDWRTVLWKVRTALARVAD